MRLPRGVFDSASYVALWRAPGAQVWKPDVGLAIQGDLVGVGGIQRSVSRRCRNPIGDGLVHVHHEAVINDREDDRAVQSMGKRGLDECGSRAAFSILLHMWLYGGPQVPRYGNQT